MVASPGHWAILYQKLSQIKANPLKRHPYLVLVAVLIVGIGGNFAWQAYEDHQRAEAFKVLLDGVDCSSCAARKASVAEKAQQRREERARLAAGEQAETETPDVSLIEILQNDPPVDLSDHVEQAEQVEPGESSALTGSE